jgi:hypothetical protein
MGREQGSRVGRDPKGHGGQGGPGRMSYWHGGEKGGSGERETLATILGEGIITSSK